MTVLELVIYLLKNVKSINKPVKTWSGSGSAKDIDILITKQEIIIESKGSD